MISDKLAWVNAKITEAAKKAGRDPKSVRLVAVSKTVTEDKIIEAQKAGANLFGENRVQEALEKINHLGRDGFAWHLIGHLQKNKVKHVIGHFDLIHSVDSVDLARVIDEKSRARSLVTRILIQVNVSGEASKSGVAPEDLEATLRAVSKMQAVRVEGLMTIPPFAPDPEQSRDVFSQLLGLRDQMAELAIEGVYLQELSMGMSHDFPVAIEEGATLVRVGTAIFGERTA
ncbi:MAG: YggS family pyridoxal phosphate enzyme [Nitrospinaceae bacterium]|nr:MAG: YggS family pyridoxal phosphate enzyme [Nitrospinaceae bacterium]